jgi:Kdo2-lipid IVA lauroyltransferase/acyltransferase
MARPKPTFLGELEYRLGVALPVAAIRALPFARAFRLGEALGGAAYRLARPQRRTALVNLRIAFPERSEREHLEIVRATCRNLGRMAAEFCHLPSVTRENVEQRVRFADRQYWDDNNHIIGTTGILVLTGHFGNWELLAHAMGLYGTPIHLIHRPFRNPAFERFVNAERARAGTGLISKRQAAREVVRVLRSNGIVAIPFDQNATGRWGVFAPFFGVPASTHPGLARLAQLSGAPVYPVFLVRENGSPRHRIEIGREVELVHDGDREAATIENLTRMNAVFADVVRRHPDHWIWMHKRWRTRPPGEPSLYG